MKLKGKMKMNKKWWENVKTKKRNTYIHTTFLKK